MVTKLVTCPESAHLEEIELERTQLGVVIRACSAWTPCRGECPRTCAARLDRKHAIGTLILARSCLVRGG